MKHTYRTLALGAVATLAITRIAPGEIRDAEPKDTDVCKPYIVFDGTESPDGRYAVAWGLPKHPDIWAEVCESFREKEHRGFEDDETLRNLIPEDDVETYIVDTSAAKIVHDLTTHDKLVSNYWKLPQLVPNRHDYEVVWARAGNVVLINHGFRTRCVQFCAVPIKDGKAGSALDLNKTLASAVLRNYMGKLIPRGTRLSKNDVEVAYREVKQLDTSKFSVVASAGNYTKDNNSWSEDAVIEFILTSAGENPLSVKLLSIRLNKSSN